ncbi:hypothetical protein [Arthrobacter sp. RAF14]|uniref:hypothetical protein n=1 Tax=Arthrobacter sp. RAF14 TaxID=3233051 RepID=UPI003F921DEC
MKTFGKGATCLLASIGLLGGAAAIPAQASASLEPQPSSTTHTGYVRDCLTQVDAYNASQGRNVSHDECKTTVTTQLDASAPVTVAEVRAASGLSASEKRSLVAAATAGAVQSRHWSQFTTGGAYTRTQNGTMFFNGSEVWVTEVRHGYQGSHNCFTNYTVEVNISDRACNESGALNFRVMNSIWNVNLNGTPITYDASMQATVRANGSIEGFGATIG